MRCGKLEIFVEIHHVAPILTIQSQPNSRLSKSPKIWPLVNVQVKHFHQHKQRFIIPPERVALSKFEAVQAKLDAAIDTCEITLVCHVKWTYMDLHGPAWTCHLHRTFQGWQLILIHTDVFLRESIHLPEFPKAVPGDIALFENSPFCHLSPGEKLTRHHEYMII